MAGDASHRRLAVIAAIIFTSFWLHPDPGVKHAIDLVRRLLTQTTKLPVKAVSMTTALEVLWTAIAGVAVAVSIKALSFLDDWPTTGGVEVLRYSDCKCNEYADGTVSGVHVLLSKGFQALVKKYSAAFWRLYLPCSAFLAPSVVATCFRPTKPIRSWWALQAGLKAFW